MAFIFYDTETTGTSPGVGAGRLFSDLMAT